MGVNVDEARRDQFAPGINLFLALGSNAADFDNAAVTAVVTPFCDEGVMSWLQVT